MVKKLFCSTLILILFGTFLPASGQKVQGIAAVVNDEIISKYDVAQRIKLMVSAATQKVDDKYILEMRTTVLEILINEKLQLQEAKRLGIIVSEIEISKGIQFIENRNKMPKGKLRELLAERKIPISTLVDQIRAQIAWNKLVTQQIHSRIKVSEEEVEAALERIEGNNEKNRAQNSIIDLHQIFFSLSKNSSEGTIEKIMASAKNLSASVKGCDKFSKLAKKTGSPESGSLGRIRISDTPYEFREELQNLEIGQASEPVRTLKGIHVLMICDRVTPKFVKENRLKVIQEIGKARANMLTQRYISDLKRNAIIDLR